MRLASVSVVAEASVPETGLAATGGVGSVYCFSGCKLRLLLAQQAQALLTL